MKKIIFLFAVALMLSACGATSSKSVEIAQNEQGLYGLKSGSKWIVDPVYVKMGIHNCEAGNFFFAEEIPGAQEFYNVIYNHIGEFIKKCNISSVQDEIVFFITQKGEKGYFSLGTSEEEIFSDEISTPVGFWK